MFRTLNWLWISLTYAMVKNSKDSFSYRFRSLKLPMKQLAPYLLSKPISMFLISTNSCSLVWTYSPIIFMISISYILVSLNITKASIRCSSWFIFLLRSASILISLALIIANNLKPTVIMENYLTLDIFINEYLI